MTGHAESAGSAEYAAIPTASLAVISESISASQAAALPLAGLAALRLLRVAGNVTGRRILLTGASGGVAGKLHIRSPKPPHLTSAQGTADRNFSGVANDRLGWRA